MKCAFIKPDQSRCRANCLDGSKWCSFHDPSHTRQFAAGRRRGGVERSRPGTLPPDTPDLPLGTADDVRRALAEVYNSVRTGRMSVSVGACLSGIAGQLGKAIEDTDLQAQIDELKALAATTGRGPRR